MRTKISVSLFVLFRFACAIIRGEDVVRDHDITIEDMETIATITGCVASPDGKYAAFTDLRWKAAADGRDLDLWAAATAGDEVRRLTFENASDGSPQWSADGRWIYFTSARGGEKEPPYNGKTQVWRISLDGERALRERGRRLRVVARRPDAVLGEASGPGR